jgi:hypothetical protein
VDGRQIWSTAAADLGRASPMAASAGTAVAVLERLARAVEARRRLAAAPAQRRLKPRGTPPGRPAFFRAPVPQPQPANRSRLRS